MSKITANVQKFFDALLSSGLVNKKNAEQLPLLWANAHVGRPCPALVEKSKDETRIGKPCGRPCMTGEDTCLCHLPKEKRDVFSEKAKQTRRDNSELKKMKQENEPKQEKQAKEKKVKEQKVKEEKQPKEKKVKEEKQPKEKVKQPKENNGDETPETNITVLEKKVKKEKKKETHAVDPEIKPSALDFDSVEHVNDIVESDPLPPMTIATAIATAIAASTTCEAVIKNGAKKGTMCGNKKVVSGTHFCAKHSD